MDPLTKNLTIIFLVTTMAAIGLKVTTKEIASAVIDNRSLMLRSLAVNLIIVPVIGLLLVKLLPMSMDAQVGILLLASAPGGLNAIQFTSKSKDALCFAASLLFILTVLSVFLSPLIAGLMLPAGTHLILPYGRVIKFVFLYLFLPLAAGLAFHRVSKSVANLLSKPMTICGTIFFVVVVIRLMTQRKQAMSTLSKTELAAMIVLIVSAILIGWLFGGPSSQTRRILATTTSMRNAALCLLIAINSFPGTDVIVAVVAFSGLMIPPNMLLMVYEIIKERKSSGG